MSEQDIGVAMTSRRKEIIRDFFSSTEGQELIRLDAALTALTASVPHSDWHGWDLCKAEWARTWPPHLPPVHVDKLRREVSGE